MVHELTEAKVKCATHKEPQERHTNTEDKIELYCDKCNFVTKSILIYSEIREHMREKHRIFKCDICDITSLSDVGLKVHTTKVNAKLDPVETKQEKTDVPVKKSINSDVKRVAEKVRFMCPSCRKYFSIEHRLFNHVYPYERCGKLSN